MKFLAAPAFLVIIATPTQAADIHKIIVGVFTAAIAVAAITLALSMPAAAGFTGNDMLPPARLTAPLINEGMQDLMETASRSEHAPRMVGGTIAFRDRRVPTHVAHWGRDPPNSIGRCAL